MKMDNSGKGKSENGHFWKGKVCKRTIWKRTDLKNDNSGEKTNLKKDSSGERTNLKKDSSGKEKYEKGQLWKGKSKKKTVLERKHMKKEHSGK